MFILNQPVDMVAIHNFEGNVTPLRFRIDGEDGKQVCLLKIINRDRDKTKLAFHCRTIINGSQHEVEMHYIILEHKWMLANVK